MGSALPLRRCETMLPQSQSDSTTRVLQHHKDARLRRSPKPLVRHNSTIEPITSRPNTPPPTPRPKPRKLPRDSTSSRAPVRTPKPPQIQVILPSAASPITSFRTMRTSSPLAPISKPLPGRPVFPRSKPDVDLYRTAIKMRMRQSPDGMKILSMGPRLALEVASVRREMQKIVGATEELERLIAESGEDVDVLMSDPAPFSKAKPTVTQSSLAMPLLTASWVVVKGGPEDWEMVDCAA